MHNDLARMQAQQSPVAQKLREVGLAVGEDVRDVKRAADESVQAAKDKTGDAVEVGVLSSGKDIIYVALGTRQHTCRHVSAAAAEVEEIMLGSLRRERSCSVCVGID